MQHWSVMQVAHPCAIVQTNREVKRPRESPVAIDPFGVLTYHSNAYLDHLLEGDSPFP
jgi:hypothetical protein